MSDTKTSNMPVASAKSEGAATPLPPILEAAVFGFAAGAAAVALSVGVDSLGAWRIAMATKYPPYLILPALGFAGGTIAGLLVQRVAPQASGSGIPQVRAALERMKMPLDWRIAAVKLVGGTIALGSGLFMGREGPTVQMGAALAATLGRYVPGAKAYRRQLIAAGAGAGLAAAFNAPVAGAIFVLEELLKEVTPATVIISLAATSSATLALQWLWPRTPHPTAHLNAAQIVFQFSDLPFYLLLAAICAVAARAFNDGILSSLHLYKKIRFLPVSLKVGLAGLATGLIIAQAPQSFHDYAAIRSLIVAGAENWKMVAFALFEFYVLTLIAYGSGAPGGLFAPSLAMGACLGYLTGLFECAFIPAASPTTFALVGMGAFFAAVARVPLTAVVITFELTGSFTVLTPLMVTCLVASTLGEFLSPGSLYERLMEWNGLQLVKQRNRSGSAAGADRGAGDNVGGGAAAGGGAGSGAGAKPLVHSLLVRDVSTVDSNTRVKDLPDILAGQRYQGMPVVDGGSLVGIVTQDYLANLLHDEVALNSLTAAQVMTLHPVSVSPSEPLEDILRLFTHQHYTWLPVTEDDRFHGVIYQNDVVKALFAAEINANEDQFAPTTVEKVIDDAQETDGEAIPESSHEASQEASQEASHEASHEESS